MLRRALLRFVLVYVTIDFASALLPGAVNFDDEVLGTIREYTPTASDVSTRPADGPPRLSAVLPSRPVRRALIVARRVHTPLRWALLSMPARRVGSPPPSEDH